MNQIANVEARRSVTVDLAHEYGMEPDAFEQTVRHMCSPKGQNTKPLTREEFAAFLLVAKHHRLNPLLKEIYAFPIKGGGIQPIVSIDGWANLINSHPAADGMEFHDQINDEGKLVSITCRIFRKDRAHPIEATEYMAECNRAAEDRYNAWNKWPRRMLRHKAMIQAARYAFGFAGIYDPDEGERLANSSPTPPSAPVPPPAPQIDHEPKRPEKAEEAREASPEAGGPEQVESTTDGPQEAAGSDLPPIRDYDPQIEDWMGQIRSADDAGILAEIWDTIRPYIEDKQVLDPDADKLREARAERAAELD